MEAILPYNTQDREQFTDIAINVGFHEFVALKYIYTMQDSDLDMFQLMGRERLEMLLYGWEVCQMHWDDLPDKQTIPENLQTVLKRLAQQSLDMWFSKEWDQCQPKLRAMFMVCINRARPLLVRLPEHKHFNWDYVFGLGIQPWSLPYLDKFKSAEANPNVTLTQTSEHIEEPATSEDIAHLKKEGLVLLLLRLIKLFDAGTMEGVRCLSMRIIAAWNHEYDQFEKHSKRGGSLPNEEEHKQCLVLICHIYLMAIYEMDDVRGFVIDNMINNIRFYYNSMRENGHIENGAVDMLEYTPARYIAMTCLNLGISSNDFFDAFIFDTYDESFVSLFGVISQSYMSYLLGNLLMQMNNLNEDDFMQSITDYKRLINLYVIERERSELFMLNEMHKKDLQDNSHSLTAPMPISTDFKSKMCKGNRMSNIGSCEHMDADEKKLLLQEESEKRIDPIFESVPVHEHVLCYVYGVLAQRSYKGWHYAKLVLLLKIIGMELNAIETWRYHPGLTTEFMLNLELKLARRFEALAQIFGEHPFMEQEFWLTAFYLKPCNKLYQKVVRCGMRYNRLNRHYAAEEEDEKPAVNLINAKFGLLSSTIDVQAIVHMANHEAPEIDYDPLYEALRSFKLPEHVIKDLLTVTFLPRNKSFAWAVNWGELRKRCKNLLKNATQKRHLVELNMAEANDRLKYLKIDYEKYKHRPQLDYGTIEEGYESVNLIPYDNKDDFEDDDDEEDFEADSDLDTPHKEEPKKQDHSELFDNYFMSTRRTRARAAAVIATALSREDSDMRREKEDEPKVEEIISKEIVVVAGEKVDAANTTEEKRDLGELLKERNIYSNDTNGFNPFPDIWNLDAKELQTVQSNCIANLETGGIFQKFEKFKTLKIIEDYKEIEWNHIEKQRLEEALKAKQSVRDDNTDDKSSATQLTHSTPKKDAKMVDAPTVTERKESDNEMMQEDENYDSDVSTVAQRDSEEVSEYFNESYEATENQEKTQKYAEPKAETTPLKERKAAELKSVRKFKQAKAETGMSPVKRYKAAKAEIKLSPAKEFKGVNEESQTSSYKKQTVLPSAAEQSDATVVDSKAMEVHATLRKSPESDKRTTPRKVSSESTETAHTSYSEYTTKSDEFTESDMKSPSEEDGRRQRRNSEQEELMKLCTEKQLQVNLRRLTVADITQLRQPKVRLERLNMEVIKGHLMKRRIKRKVFFDSDDTSKSSSGSIYGDRSLAHLLKHRLYSSESSTESEEYRKRRPVGRALRGRGGYSSGSSSGPGKRGRPRKMVVTPRSSSGLKLCISSMSTGNANVASTSGAGNNKQIPVVDFIQITSSSSSSSEEITDEQYAILRTHKQKDEQRQSQPDPMTIDPLYEEEIPIYRTKY